MKAGRKLSSLTGIEVHHDCQEQHLLILGLSEQRYYECGLSQNFVLVLIYSGGNNCQPCLAIFKQSWWDQRPLNLGPFTISCCWPAFSLQADNTDSPSKGSEVADPLEIPYARHRSGAVAYSKSSELG